MFEGKCLAELERMRQAALVQQAALDDARARYSRQMKIRDERVEMLNQVKMQIEKLRIMVKHPDTPKVQLSWVLLPNRLRWSSPAVCCCGGREGRCSE